MRETTLDKTGPDGNWRRRRSADGRGCRRLVQPGSYPHKNWTRFWGLHNTVIEARVVLKQWSLENTTTGAPIAVMAC